MVRVGLISKPAPKILVLAGTGFLRAYSGTLYLVRELLALGRGVEVWVVGKEDEAAEYEGLGIGVAFQREAQGGWLEKKLCHIGYRLKVLLAMMRAGRVIITENTFLVEAACAKMICGRRFRFVQFAQELHLVAEYPDLPRIGFCERLGLARYARQVVDVEPNRARVRQVALGLVRTPMVLRNTLPRSNMPQRAGPGCLSVLSGQEFPTGMPILLHMGGIGREKPLERVIEAVAVCPIKVFLLAFCSGSEEQILKLARHAAARLEAGTFSILGPRRRDDLLAAAWEADVGIIDYSPSVENTSNQRYCAPTKLYEFMALGLAIVGSDNDSLREIVEGEEIGYCAAGGSVRDLAVALAKVVGDPKRLGEMKARGAVSFKTRHCYEVLCSPVVREMARMLEE